RPLAQLRFLMHNLDIRTGCNASFNVFKPYFGYFFMNKVLVSSVLAVLLLAGTASAQSYGSGCMNISRDLVVGSRGSEVRDLQRFLVSRNYPGSGDWMITGN